MSYKKLLRLSHSSILRSLFWVATTFACCIIFISNNKTQYDDDNDAMTRKIMEKYKSDYNFQNLVSLSIDPSSVFNSSIVGLYHDPYRGVIILELNTSSVCTNPALRARLSGPALSILDWTKRTKDSRIWLEGRYHVPISGMYYLEILIIYCNNIQYDEYFTNHCIENPQRNRITTKGTQIQITRSSPDRFYWKRKSDITKNVEPLYTRYQPQGCRNRMRRKGCKEPGGLFGQFDVYEFYNDTYAKELYTKIIKKQQQNHRICYIGSSHARVLNEHTNKYYPKIHTYQSDMSFSMAKPMNIPGNSYVRWPESFDTKTNIVDLIHNNKCTKFIIGIGQWPLSFATADERFENAGGHPYTLHQYEESMTDMLRRIKAITNLPNNVEIYIRSMHYNAIGDWIGTCPNPLDWRSPAAVDEYNHVLQKVTNTVNIPFIDTNHIIGPMWDSAEDWCHFINIAGITEALYIAAKVYGVLTDDEASSKEFSAEK